MLANAPKNSRNKRLHIVFFTDASKTKSTSISVRNLALIGCVTAGFFTAAATSLYLYRQNKSLVESKNDYIRELKSAISSLAVTSEKNQIQMANESDPQTDIARRIAREIHSPVSADKKIASGQQENTLASLQSSLSSLSTVSANLARNENKNQTIDFAKNPASSKAETTAEPIKPAAQQLAGGPGQGMSSSADAQVAGGTTATGSALTGIQIEHGHTTEANGQTTLHFQLVITARQRGRSWTGRVCGIAELNPGAKANIANRPTTASQVSLSARAAHAGNYISLPSGFQIDSGATPSNACADGELVRFSRLRPTELVVPVKQDAIKKVTIFFVESGSNRFVMQPIEM